MLNFSARAFYWIGQHLKRSFEDCLGAATGGQSFHVALLHEDIDDETKRKVLVCLKWTVSEAWRVGMPITSATAQEVQEALKNDDRAHNYQWLMDNIRQIQKLIEKELQGKAFLYITPEKVRFWPTEKAMYIFGEDVHKAFPSAATDISEAGICLALSRATACVFHLMRA